jgi:integrase/recombinase XerC
MVRELGRRLGMKVWPHGLRHAAITEALDLTGGNVRAVQRFSRHRDVRVLERYDDNRRDLGGEVAKLFSLNGALVDGLKRETNPRTHAASPVLL